MGMVLRKSRIRIRILAEYIYSANEGFYVNISQKNGNKTRVIGSSKLLLVLSLVRGR
mgnify:CR=1 FL=1